MSKGITIRLVLTLSTLTLPSESIAQDPITSGPAPPVRIEALADSAGAPQSAESIVVQLIETYPGDFASMPYGLSTASGEPKLWGWSGTPCNDVVPLSSGTSCRLAITDGVPDAPAYIVMGVGCSEPGANCPPLGCGGPSCAGGLDGFLALPFRGGVLLPRPDLVLSVQLDARGRWASNDLLLENVLPYTAIFMQAWILDAAGPFGFQATNALSGVIWRSDWPWTANADNPGVPEPGAPCIWPPKNTP